MADFDGDGLFDAVVMGGDPASVKMFWGPAKKDVHDPKAWIDGGAFPQLVNKGHFLDVKADDLNGDGVGDIIAGGRVSASETSDPKALSGKARAGLFWIEAPKEKEVRRDLSKWVVHYIDPETPGAFGFVPVDVDGDGDHDVAVCNADWNTRDDEQAVAWYENPGRATPEQGMPWKKHVIYQGHGEISTKSQLGEGDLNGDGLVDFCIQTDNTVLIFQHLTRSPDTWKTITVPKPEYASFCSRPTKMVDLNGDGRLEIVGALIHDTKGNLPKNKASVFWMENKGNPFRQEEWITHVIKWAEGSSTGHKFQGEKWDNLRFAYVDGDGRLDIVANSEEYYIQQGKQKITQVGAVWFENPGR